MKARYLVAAAALVAVTGTASADLRGSPESQALVSQGFNLALQGRGQEALAKLQEAAKLSPNASMPLSGIAHLLYENCAVRKPDDQNACYDQAKACLRIRASATKQVRWQSAR